MSRLPTITASVEPILPGAGRIDDAPYLGNPETGGGIARLGAGIASLGGAADDYARAQRATKHANDQRFITDLNTRLLKTASDGKEAAAAVDPNLSMQTFDETMNPILEEIEGIEDENLKSRAKYEYAQSYYGMRGQVANMTTRRTADMAVASVANLEAELLRQVALGDTSVENALTTHAQQVNGYVGTALDHEAAQKSLQRFESAVLGTYADRMVEEAQRNPEAAESLRAQMDTPAFRLGLSREARGVIFNQLDAAEQKGHVNQWRSAVTQTREGFARYVMSDRTPTSLKATIDETAFTQHVNDTVAGLRAYPGRELDPRETSPKTDEELRIMLLKEPMEYAAAVGDKKAFGVIERAMDAPTFAEDAAKLRRTMLAQDTQKSRIEKAADGIMSAWAMQGRINPEDRVGKALDKATEELLLAGESPTKIAKWFTRDNVPLSKPIVDVINDGFPDGAAAEADTAAAAAVLKEVKRHKPEYARSLAEATKRPEAATVMLELDGDADMARLLMSPEGDRGLKVATTSLTKGLDPGTEAKPGSEPTIDPSLEMAADGTQMGAGPAAVRRWEAAYRLSMAQQAAQDPTILTSVDGKVTASGAASRAATAEVRRTHAMLTVAQTSESSWIWLGSDQSSVVAVDAAMYGIRPDTEGRDEATDALEAVLNGQQDVNNPRFFAVGSVVRPDLGIPVHEVGETGITTEILIPNIDAKTGAILSFIGWSPLEGKKTRDLSSGDEFDRHVNTIPYEALDPDRVIRRRAGTTTDYVADGSPAIADLFKRTMERRYREFVTTDIPLDLYLEQQAIALGWEGFAPPPKTEAAP